LIAQIYVSQITPFLGEKTEPEVLATAIVLAQTQAAAVKLKKVLAVFMLFISK